MYAATKSAFCASCSNLFERLKPDQTRCESCLRKANVERAVVLARTMKQERLTGPAVAWEMVAGVEQLSSPVRPTRSRSPSKSPAKARAGGALSPSLEEQMRELARSTGGGDADANAPLSAAAARQLRLENRELRRRAVRMRTAEEDEARRSRGPDGIEPRALHDLRTQLEAQLGRGWLARSAVGGCLAEVRRGWVAAEALAKRLQAHAVGGGVEVEVMRQELAGAEELVHELIARLRSQRGELRDARAARAAAEEAAAEVSLAARVADVARTESSVLDGVRVQVEETLRREMHAQQERIGNANVRLADFIHEQQAKRGTEIRQRQGRLAEWEKRVAALLAQQTALTGGAAAAPSAAATGGAAMVRFGERGGGERPPILAELSSLLQEAAADHATSLATLDAELRAAEAIERESYERRLALAHSELAKIAQVRVDHRDQARALGAAAAEKRVDQLNEQLAEAFGLRDESVTALSHASARQLQQLDAMRHAYADAAAELTTTLGALQGKGDGDAAALLTEVGAMREVNAHWRAQLTAGVLARWKSRLLIACWRSWLSLVARARSRAAERQGVASGRSLARSEREKLRPLEEKLAHSERRRREQVVEADEALETAWVETLRWQRRAKEAEEAQASGVAAATAEEASAAAEAMAAEAKAAAARAAEGEAAAARREAALRMEVEDLRNRLSQSAALEGAWYDERTMLREKLKALYSRASGEEAAGLAARVAELEGSEAETAARLRGLTVRCADQQEQLDEGRTALRTTREELAQERAAAREAQLEAEARHASLEEHVASMHAASWALQKQKMVRVQQLEAHNQRLKADVGRRALAHVRARGLLPCWRAWLMLVASGRETRLHLRREGERRLADAAAAQAPLALSSVMQSVSNLGARLAAPDGVLPI